MWCDVMWCDAMEQVGVQALREGTTKFFVFASSGTTNANDSDADYSDGAGGSK